MTRSVPTRRSSDLLGVTRRGRKLAALRRVVGEPELVFGKAERLCHADQLLVLPRVADLRLMAQRLSGIDILVDLRERHRGADVRLLFECAPGAAVGADILALGARLFAEHFGGEEAVEGFLVGGGGAQDRKRTRL